MKSWKWIAAAAALVVTPELALAQSPEAPRGPSGLLARYDVDGDGKVTLAEIEAAALEQIKTADADGDGKLTVQELRDGQTAARFKALDADGDGKVTLAEFQAQPDGRRGGGMMIGRDQDGDGLLSAAELTAMARRMFEMADADKNGELTAEELSGQQGERGFGRGNRGNREGGEGQEGRRGRGERRGGSPEEAFARLDADGDGAITLDEMKAATPQRRRQGRPQGEGEIY